MEDVLPTSPRERLASRGGRRSRSRARTNRRAPFPRGWEPRSTEEKTGRPGSQCSEPHHCLNEVTPARRPVLKLCKMIPVLSWKKQQVTRSSNILNGEGTHILSAMTSVGPNQGKRSKTGENQKMNQRMQMNPKQPVV